MNPQTPHLPPDDPESSDEELLDASSPADMRLAGHLARALPPVAPPAGVWDRIDASTRPRTLTAPTRWWPPAAAALIVGLLIGLVVGGLLWQGSRSELAEIRDRLADERADGKMRLAAADEQLAAAERERQILARTLADREADLAARDARLADAAAGAADLSAALTLARAERDELARRRDRLADELAERSRDLADARGQAAEVRQAVAARDDRLLTLQRDLDTLIEANDRLVFELQALEEVLASTDVLLISAGPTPDGRGRGNILLDRDGGRVRATLTDLDPLPEGRVYQLWYLAADESVTPSVTFSPIAGAARLVADVPAGVAPVALAVTDEPEGGSPQPTGTIRIVGEAP